MMITAAELGAALSSWLARGTSIIEHFVRHQQIAVERGELVALELAVGRVDLQQAVDGFGFEAGGLRQTLGGPSGRAHNNALTLFARRIFRIEFISVVLPTPGPPVITSNLEVRARRIASFWLSARAMLSFCSTQEMACSGSMCGQGGAPDFSRAICVAMERSA